jgi:hypothetical protein
MIDRSLHLISVVTMTVSLVALITVLWWLLFPYSGFTDVVQPFPVERPVVKAGGVQRYTVTACYKGMRDTAVVVTRELELVNHISRFPLTAPIEYVVTASDPECDARVMQLGIPSYVTPGIYLVRYYTHVKVNPLRRVSQVFESATFEVR